MPTSTTGSVYGGNNDVSELGEDPFIQDKELPIEDLQKQHDELIRMQQMIQEKMSTIQTAIQKRGSRENKVLRTKAKPWKSTQRISTAFANSDTNCVQTPVFMSKPPMPERLEDSCVSVSDFTSQYMTESMLTNSRQNNENEK